MDNIIDLINNNLGFSCKLVKNSKIDNSLKIQNQELRNSIIEDIEGSIGKNVLMLKFPIENYVRYKNKDLSSMVRENGKIKKHVGHIDLKVADIVDQVYDNVNKAYINEVFNELSSLFFHVKSSIYQTELNIIQTLNNKFDKEYINELNSIMIFFEEIYDEISDISASNIRCAAYLTSIISNRQKLIKLVNHFLDKLSEWPNKLLSTNQFNYYIYPNINYQELVEDHLICRQAITSYLLCLSFENILSGNIENKHKDNILQKVNRFISRFDQISGDITNALNTRNRSNRPWFRYYTLQEHMKEKDYNGITWFLENYEDNTSFDLEIIENIFEKTTLLLGNIILE